MPGGGTLTQASETFMFCCAEDVQAISKLHTQKSSRFLDFNLLIVTLHRIVKIMDIGTTISGQGCGGGTLTVNTD